MNDRRARPTLMVIGAAVAITLAACRSPRAERSSSAAAPAMSSSSPAPSAGTSAPPHGDHNPHHGGIVLMNGDLHYEIVLDPAGRSHRLFFSDAVREDLPASIASSVALTIRRPHDADEQIPLQIDTSGESWAGSGRAVTDPARAAVRVAFTIKGDTYWIDVPFEAGK
jgi:protein-tyrosine-phosphatase